MFMAGLGNSLRNQRRRLHAMALNKDKSLSGTGTRIPPSFSTISAKEMVPSPLTLKTPSFFVTQCQIDDPDKIILVNELHWFGVEREKDDLFFQITRQGVVKARANDKAWTQDGQAHASTIFNPLRNSHFDLALVLAIGEIGVATQRTIFGQ